MPTKTKDVQPKTKFARAKRKIKDVGVSMAVAAAALVPLKGAAQDRVIDADAQRISLAVDTIRLGMTVTNQSSLDKDFTIFDGVDPKFLDDDSLKNRDIYIRPENSYSLKNGKSFDGYFKYEEEEKSISKYNADEKGWFVTLVKSAMAYENWRDMHKFVYNTDNLYDKYLRILGKQFSFASTMETKNIKIVVHCVDEFVKISAYDRAGKKSKDGKYPLLGSMVVNARTEAIAGFSYDHEVFVFRTNDDMQNYRVFDGKTEKVIPVNIVNKSKRPKYISDYKVKCGR